MFYLPLLEPRPPVDDDNDFVQDPPEDEPVDLVIPFKKSLKQIAREVHCRHNHIFLAREFLEPL